MHINNPNGKFPIGSWLLTKIALMFPSDELNFRQLFFLTFLFGAFTLENF
jgi:hypothetical protein